VGSPPLRVDRMLSCGVRHLSRAFDTRVIWQQLLKRVVTDAQIMFF
jgi:hypothetical protein